MLPFIPQLSKRLQEKLMYYKLAVVYIENFIIQMLIDKDSNKNGSGR